MSAIQRGGSWARSAVFTVSIAWSEVLTTDFVFAGKSSALRPPLRPEEPGRSGRPISLQANHFQVVRLPKNDIQHYDVTITPEKTPRKLNREIIARMLAANDPKFGGLKPVYDGQKNMYARAMFPFGHEKVSNFS